MFPNCEIFNVTELNQEKIDELLNNIQDLVNQSSTNIDLKEVTRYM